MADTNNHKITFGALERIDIPAFGVKDVLAKIDTGAYTGALHCEDIKVIKDTEGRKGLSFRPVSKRHPIQTVYAFKRVEVTSASGHKAKRYVIPITLSIQGKNYDGLIGLTSRKDLRRQILIGRRFLREHNILVDVTKNQEQNDKRETV